MHAAFRRVSLHNPQELEDPELSAESKEAFDIAYENIKAFHEAQRSAPLEVETMPGVRCRRVTRPIGGLLFHFPEALVSHPAYGLLAAASLGF